MRFLSGLATLLALLTSVSQATERIVSVDGALTEIVYGLGADTLLVGVDSTSQYPPQVSKLPNVGYKR